MEYKGSVENAAQEGSLLYQAEEAWISYNPDDLLEAINTIDEAAQLSDNHVDLVYRAFISGYLTATEDLLKGEQ